MQLGSDEAVVRTGEGISMEDGAGDDGAYPSEVGLRIRLERVRRRIS